MGKTKVAINGFGRIGRLSLRSILEKDNIDIVAINDLSDGNTLAHLFKYDSVQGKFEGVVKFENGALQIGNEKMKVFSERNPENLPWKELEVDVVVESTGVFRDEEGAGKHLKAGAKRVVISAPAKGDIPTVVLGVNDEIIPDDMSIISNASCTTNCLAPMVKILDDSLGIENGFITTIHSYTSDQRILDAPHSDLRRARAAAINMIPTSTGAAVAVGKVLPKLNGKLDGNAVRVPTPSGSITDFTLTVKTKTSAEEVNSLMRTAAEGSMKGILEYSTAPLVSIDIVGNTHSCIFDSEFTRVQGNLVKVLGWYDNEMGYASRISDLVEKIG